ncbi:MAG: hypothetical protein R6V49_04600 [Bacteroidales bacterium]
MDPEIADKESADTVSSPPWLATGCMGGLSQTGRSPSGTSGYCGSA